MKGAWGVMAYSLNPHDPFADGEEGLIIPEDRFDGPVVGMPVVFIGKDDEGRKVFHERRCGRCGRTMVSPDGAPLDGVNLFVICPRRHESETVQAPERSVRYTNSEHLFDLLRVRESEAHA